MTDNINEWLNVLDMDDNRMKRMTFYSDAIKKKATK